MRHDSDWQFSDAWILASLDSSGPRQTAAHAEHLNHATPTIGELTQSLGRLVGSGLVQRHATWFGRTSAGDELVRGHRSTYDQVEVVLARLHDVPLVVDIVAIDDEVFIQAVEAYERPGALRMWWRRLAAPRRASGAHAR